MLTKKKSIWTDTWHIILSYAFFTDFKGVFCDKLARCTASNFCKNGGTCHDDEGHAKCECQDGWIGLFSWFLFC